MAVAANKWKYKLSYEQYCGGVIAIGTVITVYRISYGCGS
jgi:hypothetical protein